MKLSSVGLPWRHGTAGRRNLGFDPFWNAHVKFAAPYKIAKLYYCQESNNDTPYTVQDKCDSEADLRWCIFLVPDDNDGLLGKLKMSMNGNVIYRQQVASNLKAYHNANEEGKQTIRLQIWQVITDRGGLVKFPRSPKPLSFRFRNTSQTRKVNNKNGSKSQYSPHDDDFFFGWMFDKNRCFNLIHCKGVGTEACW